jgi:hypothetical protein
MSIVRILKKIKKRSSSSYPSFIDAPQTSVTNTIIIFPNVIFLACKKKVETQSYSLYQLVLFPLFFVYSYFRPSFSCQDLISFLPHFLFNKFYEISYKRLLGEEVKKNKHEELQIESKFSVLYVS